MSNRRDDGEFVDTPAKGELPTHAEKAAQSAGSTVSKIIEDFERNSQNAYGSGHDAAGTAYALRALEEADKRAAGKGKSFVDNVMQRRDAKAERAQDKDGGREA